MSATYLKMYPEVSQQGSGRAPFLVPKAMTVVVLPILYDVAGAGGGGRERSASPTETEGLECRWGSMLPLPSQAGDPQTLATYFRECSLSSEPGETSESRHMQGIETGLWGPKRKAVSMGVRG